jgi:dynein heavy chain
VLSNGNIPTKVNEEVANCFDGLKMFKFLEEGPQPYRQTQGMFSKDGDEYVPFNTDLVCQGAVESYLNDLELKMQTTLKEILETAKEATEEWDLSKGRHIWLDDYNAQIALLATQIVWTEETQRAFEELENGGSESAMKDYLQVTKNRIGALIERVRTDLSFELRTKIITIITIDVHERDVVEEFVQKKIADSGSFQWLKQLRFYMESKPKEAKKLCQPRICDWATWYNYEYVGNCGRLVITPLTDRCYITLTQALNLSMGGAPAGPAGTGKTETTKDLGRALGLQVVVFNCSDQMNYRSMGDIFMGLSQSGAWGCFDEFNRITIDVLSVVSTQVKTCLDAIKELKVNPNRNMFTFEDNGEIQIKITVGFWITMNPGYAGRTELPENLKALFRSCAMVVPDIVLICENMLMSEGFDTARDLSKKFMCLYNLAKSLLSEQVHYDWGLRAVKSVLRQAGALKRADVTISEEELLQRALRDFNWPKIKVEDRQIFLGLIRDLFPGIDAATIVDAELQEISGRVARERGLTVDEQFVLKNIQLADILVVRHSCFLIGVPGTAKSAVWKNLSEALTEKGWPTCWDVIDPKAVTSDELFGCMNPKTKEWKDGVLSTIMRDMNRCQGKYKQTHKYKWVVLDGDVDPEWIESLNTVMDDNKVLTLVSQERIPLTPSMRLLLEVSNLRNATPATVSRGGVLYFNESDIGWQPYKDTWLSHFKAKNDDNAITTFTLSFAHYINDSFLNDMRTKETAAPVCEMQHIISLTTIIQFLYDDLYSQKEYVEYIKRLKEEGQTVFDDAIKIIYEGFFVFALIWSFGAPLTDAKSSFNGIVRAMASRVKFPDSGYVYDYYFDVLKGTWSPWMDRVKPYDANYSGLFANLIVPSAETTRQKFLIDVNRVTRRGIIYVGFAGTGKTTIIKDYFNAVDKETTVTSSMSLNSYTDSASLQKVIESNVEKRMGRMYGPPSGKILMFFMDDLNMPKLDKYGTQSPICLIRQLIDYKLVFDRDHLDEKKTIEDIMFLGCLNPKSGSFIIDPRLTRHFTLVGLGVPDKEILNTVYHQILSSHLKNFDKGYEQYATKFVQATQVLFFNMSTNAQFAPTARKFHYQFNLRDFSKIVENLLQLDASNYNRNNTLGAARMWAHEAMRVYHDRLILPEDRTKFMEFLQNAMKEFSEHKPTDILAEPLIFTNFITVIKGHEPAYLNIKDQDELRSVLEAKMAEYNENVSSMDLVLFSLACEHITRIARICEQPCGNALLVGVGGSGKQSLSKLTAYII